MEPARDSVSLRARQLPAGRDTAARLRVPGAYVSRSTWTGSIREARRAGSHAATVLTAISTAAATANVGTSCEVMRYSNVPEMNRDAHQLSAMPAATPDPT